jgi:multidrug efflux pump subunit AcrB
MISLFAFILILGIVVDDAIVVGENIFRKREKGIEPFKAAVDGTVQMARPVIFAVLTTIAAFWPLLTIGGVRGNIMKNIPIVVILVLLGSLAEALLILPSHLARSRFKLPAGKDEKKKEKPANRWLKELIRGPYHIFLKKCLKWRYATLAFGIALLIASISLLTSGRIKMTIFPKMDSDMLICSIVMAPSTPVAKTREILNHIEQSAIDMLKEFDAKRPEGAPPLLEEYYSLLGIHMSGMGPGARGSIGGHLAQVHIQLISGEDRDIKATYLAGEWRKKTGRIPAAESISFTGQLHGGGTAVEIHLSSDDHDRLLSAVEAMKSRLHEYTGLRDINDDYMPGKNELQLNLLPEARSLGITLNDLASQVRAAFYGAEGLRIQRGQDEVKVLVRYPDAERKSLGNIETMRIRMPDGTEIPFNRVAKVSMEKGYATISRSHRQRVIAVSADINEETANSTEVNNDLIDKILPEMRSAWPGVRFAIEGAGKRNQEFMADILKSFIFAIFLIYALLAIPFRSFSQPFIVMSAIPFGMVGALLGHLIMGYDLSMMSLFGIVGLSGVVVNDSLILIEATNRLRERGKSHFDSIVTAGTVRFRPIVLTSLTTFGSLMPMILERSIQAKFLIPMAAGLAYGVLFATGITLLLIPCLYLILEDIHNTAIKIRAKILE